MKKILFLMTLLLPLLAAEAQEDYGHVASRFRTFYNQQQSDSIFAMFSPEVKAALPPDKTKQMVTQLQSQFGELQSVDLIKQDTNYANYKAVFASTTLIMNIALDKAGRIAGIHFMPYTAPSPGDAKSNVTLPTQQGNIYGTLLTPEKTQKVPVVLIIAGSGPTDRNGNSALGLHTNMYQMLADSLLTAGIATLRYDKRGIGQSAGAMKSESDLTFENYISDAAGWIKMLKSDPRFSKVIVLGHSEGSLIGMVAAQRAQADGYISLAGAGDRIDKILERQLSEQSPDLAAKATVLLDSLVRGHTVQQPDSTLSDLFRSSVQPYMISWLKYNPQVEIAKLTIPVLILQGTTDLQVSVSDAQLLKRAKPDATLQLIDGMNHIGKEASADRTANFATYSNPALPLKTDLVKDVENFVLLPHH